MFVIYISLQLYEKISHSHLFYNRLGRRKQEGIIILLTQKTKEQESYR